MLIVCPACASEYEIPIDRVGPGGRQVRCAACRETWSITPQDVAAASSVPSDVSLSDMGAEGTSLPALSPQGGAVIEQPTPYPQQQASPQPKRPRRAPAASKKRRPSGAKTWRPSAAVIAAGLTVLVVGPLALLGRNAVVSMMPQTAALYAGIGMPVNLRAIDIRDVAAFQNPPLGDKPGELIVEGDLVGVGRERIDVPDLAVEIRDEHGQVLYRWTVPAPRPVLEGTGSARFRASLSSPPAAGRSVELRFASATSPQGSPGTNDAAKDTPH